MKKLLLIGLLLLGALAHAQRITCSGIVTDASTGETLVNATVYIEGKAIKGTITNENGFFVLPGITDSEIQLIFNFVGYEKRSMKLTNEGEPIFVEIELLPSKISLEQVTVVANGIDQLGDQEIEISQHTLTPKAIKSIPVARNDVFKALRYLPGIEPTEPLSPLVSVRGSDPGENLIMLDGVTIYNPYHFMSSSGIFNMQTVKNVDMMVGGFGAAYGGRNSSVINIVTKDGNSNGMHGEIKPTTAESKVFLEFPVGEKTTMMVAGRLNYDLFGNFLLYSNNYFYDANVSLTHRFDAKNRLSLKYFTSKDKTNIDFNAIYKYMGNTIGMEDIFNDMSLKWVNRWHNNVATAIWKSVVSPNLYLRTQASASLHRADNFGEMVMNVENVVFDTQTRFSSKVNDWTGKFTLNYQPLIWNTLQVGAEYSSYLFLNKTELNRIENGEARKQPFMLAAFLEDKVSWGPLLMRGGIRTTKFNQQKPVVEPRLNAVLKFHNNLKIQAAWGIYTQHIVSMNTQEFEFNQFLDYYYPLDKRDPSRSVQYILGAEKEINRKHTFSIDLYYKDISRTYTFDLLQDEMDAFGFSDKIVAGNGRSLGMELMWKGSFGQFSGWGSYTLSKSTRSFPHIMNGEEYDYDYDRRHSLKAVMNYQASKRIAYSASLLVQSGIPKSIENTLQMFYMYDPLSGQMIYSPQYTVPVKNAARLPWLFYLDLGLEKKVVSGFGKDLAEFFGADASYFVVNVYNVLFFRRNVMYYMVAGGYDKYIPFGDNYFPTVSAGYTIKF